MSDRIVFIKYSQQFDVGPRLSKTDKIPVFNRTPWEIPGLGHRVFNDALTMSVRQLDKRMREPLIFVEDACYPRMERVFLTTPGVLRGADGIRIFDLCFFNPNRESIRVGQGFIVAKISIPEGMDYEAEEAWI